MDSNLTAEKSAMRTWWTITVTGYGPFAYYGTVDETRDRMRAKAVWEGGRGSMRAATDAEIEKEKEVLGWKRSAGYQLDERELEAIK